MEDGIHPRWAPHQAHLGLLALQVSSQATTITREVHTSTITREAHTHTIPREATEPTQVWRGQLGPIKASPLLGTWGPLSITIKVIQME